VSDRSVTFHNAVVYTVDSRRPKASWFSVLGHRFQRLGSGPPPSGGKQIDLGGQCVVPGFVDAHTHFFQTGLDRLHVDLTGVGCFDELVSRLEEGAPRGKRTWIFAHSFEEDSLTDLPQLTRDDLDRVFPNRPVWLNRVDYHSAVVNSAALRRLAIPASAEGLMTSLDGSPNGVLRAYAYFHAKAAVSRLYSVETKERAVKEAVNACVPHGITAVAALEGGRIFSDEGVQAVLRRADKAPVHITLFLQEKNAYLTSRFGFEHLGGCILVDGSIGSYTAALDSDYLGHPGVRGMLYERPREFRQFVDEGHAAGCQLAFHAIGPRAIELVLDAYEYALRRHPRWDHRHRIEHFELATDEQIRRAADLGLVIGMQPAFEYFWGGPNGMYASRLGDDWRRTNRLAEILDAGIVIAGGSDTNVTPANPLLGIHAAVNHPNPEQRISIEAALRMMTLDAAYGCLTDHLFGSISPGKNANFAVLDRDITSTPRAEIKDIRVRSTWHRGRCVWRAQESASGPHRRPTPRSHEETGTDADDA